MYRLYSNDSERFSEPILGTTGIKPTEIALPQTLQPSLPPLEGSYKDTQFYALKDKTGVLVLGSFESYKEESIKCNLLQGLRRMRELGIENLIIDLVSTLRQIR